jgi:hypothetical protein
MMIKLDYEQFMILRDKLRGKRVGKQGLYREFEFLALGRSYKVFWLITECTLKFGIAGTVFTHYEISDAIGNAYKLNLILGTANEHYVTIPLEKI